MNLRRIAAATAAALAATTFLVVIPRPAAAEPDPNAAARGSWTVTSVGSQRYAVTWRSPARLPITSDRPTIVVPTGMTVATSTVAADRRTVRAVVRSASGPPDPVRLDVLLSGDRLDHVGRDRAPAAAAAAQRRSSTSAVAPALPGAPGLPGPYPGVTSASGPTKRSHRSPKQRSPAPLR